MTKLNRYLLVCAALLTGWPNSGACVVSLLLGNEKRSKSERLIGWQRIVPPIQRRNWTILSHRGEFAFPIGCLLCRRLTYVVTLLLTFQRKELAV